MDQNKTITIEEVLKIREEMYQRSVAIIRRKGEDYNAQVGTKNALFNLRVCSILGIVPNPCQGILVRLSDKFCRLISLITSGKNANFESLEDTILDFHNYLDYLVAFLREEEQETKFQPDYPGQMQRLVNIVSSNNYPNSLTDQEAFRESLKK